ncbi:unnamed protein product [Porites evermanni]|uniref:Uncharacterized protein n=1 Tax=Porites evermanni TaxID=104178 RepID=A0ABN8STV4_9CNID|nr:unnamed protein product [Porites evermanni]
MGIFNEQSLDHPFARGIQGAPGVGFNLTSSGDYDMINKKLRNVGAPSANTDAVTKKYVDDNSSGSVDGSVFLKLDGTRKMTGNLDMDNNQILNLPAPGGPKQPTPLAFTDLKYLHVGGTNKMTNNLNMDNKGIIHLKPPTNDTDGATKKYVDDSIPDTNAATKKYVDDNAGSPDLSDYLEKDSSVAMTGNLNLGSNKIVGLATPTLNTDAATKKYVDDNAGSPDLSDYLEKDGSVAMTGELNAGGNKIINIGKPLQNSDAVNKGYVDKLVHKTAVQPSHYKNEFSYLMSSGSQWTDEIDGGNSFSIDKIDDLPPNKGNFHDYNHKSTFSRKFSGVYLIANGIMGTFSIIDPDKVYDYHTAFDIKPTEVVYNVDINANQKAIKNIKLERQSDNSAATVALVKELAPFTKNAWYRLYFSEFYDFADADSYRINIGSSGVIINSLKPNITLPAN